MHAVLSADSAAVWLTSLFGMPKARFLSKRTAVFDKVHTNAASSAYQQDREAVEVRLARISAIANVAQM